MSLDEATRQLEIAIHDAQVAFDCIGLGEVDRAHTNTITARTATDAAEAALRQALADKETKNTLQAETEAGPLPADQDG